MWVLQLEDIPIGFWARPGRAPAKGFAVSHSRRIQRVMGAVMHEAKIDERQTRTLGLAI
jgi:hypothetical protein